MVSPVYWISSVIIFYLSSTSFTLHSQHAFKDTIHMPERFFLGTYPSPTVTLEEFEGGYGVCFWTLLYIFQTKISDVSFPTSLNSLSRETNEQPIPATGSLDHKALPNIRAEWLEFNFKVVKTTFSSAILPCKSEPLSHPSAVFGPLALTLPLS